MSRLYYPLSEYLKGLFGCKVFKVSINAGFTCPNRDGTKGRGGCVFCEQKTLEPLGYDGSADIRTQLLTGMERVRKRHRAEKFIAYFQINTNTHAPVELLRSIYSGALCPEVAGVAVSTRPDCVSEEVASLLGELNKKTRLWVELGLQSSNDRTLEAVNRGHTAEDFRQAVERLASLGIETCAHMIVGLPGEGESDAVDTARFISRLPVKGIKFHQLQVIKGTRLEEMYLRGEVRVLTLDEYAGTVVECLEVLSPEVVIHRLSGDAPRGFIAAPQWGANKFIITEQITGLLKEKNTFQGARFEGPVTKKRGK